MTLADKSPADRGEDIALSVGQLRSMLELVLDAAQTSWSPATVDALGGAIDFAGVIAERMSAFSERL